jgi:uncharacterized membrane protein
MMSDRSTPPDNTERPVVSATGLLEERTERLTPLYDTALRIFTWGFRIGAVLLILGIVLTLVQGQRLAGEAAPFSVVLSLLLAGNAAGVIDLAIIWFMFVPVVAVVAVAAAFWRMGDRRYAALSLVVLAILGASIALALTR